MCATAHTAFPGSERIGVFRSERMILKRLKVATRERHLALEGQLPLLNPQMSLQTYRQIVRRFLGFYAPLESQIVNASFFEHAGFNYRLRLKTPNLVRDLTALGDPVETLAHVQQCMGLPGLASTAQIAGCIYVIEGANLGGQIIIKHLRANLGITPETGASFFNGYGVQTGPLWLGFCQWADSRTELADCSEEVIASANQTFATLETWLFPKTDLTL
jgi:heme oxygenase (biliverdin-IX-beta and delta-forming)